MWVWFCLYTLLEVVILICPTYSIYICFTFFLQFFEVKDIIMESGMILDAYTLCSHAKSIIFTFAFFFHFFLLLTINILTFPLLSIDKTCYEGTCPPLLSVVDLVKVEVSSGCEQYVLYLFSTKKINRKLRFSQPMCDSASSRKL